ncbi:uncharacterized protein LOC105158499 [Sesamum indicum]|uniref:Uncharacterized protein LOC105158499 n=1 Tax=Sesamum indicum TaxID=4182 RepID=A0A6I9SST7_SESIN|nr:uncharacterized protein LOC105158499 [Sesamum indicum]
MASTPHQIYNHRVTKQNTKCISKMRVLSIQHQTQINHLHLQQADPLEKQQQQHALSLLLEHLQAQPKGEREGEGMQWRRQCGRTDGGKGKGRQPGGTREWDMVTREGDNEREGEREGQARGEGGGSDDGMGRGRRAGGGGLEGEGNGQRWV